MDADLGARAISIDAHHHRADTAVAVEPDRLRTLHQAHFQKRCNRTPARASGIRGPLLLPAASAK